MSINRQFFPEERAATPVISSILMVAIVAILATVISASAVGVASETSSPAPQVSFNFNTDDVTGDVIVTKSGGATFGGDQVKFSGAALEKPPTVVSPNGLGKTFELVTLQRWMSNLARL